MYIVSTLFKAALSSWWIWWEHTPCRGFAIPFHDCCGIVSVSALRAFKDIWGKPGMCLFVRSPFIIGSYFKTNANHQSCYLNHYILLSRAFMNYITMRKQASKQERTKETSELSDTWYRWIWISIHLVDSWSMSQQVCSVCLNQHSLYKCLQKN